MTATFRSNTRVTRSYAKQKLVKRSTRYNRISRQSLRIAIQASIQLAQQHKIESGGKTDTTEPSVHTPVPCGIQPMTTQPDLSEERRDANVPQQGANAGIANRNGIESSRKGWYYIRNVMAEVGQDDRHMYLVEWEGTNPMTGTKWPNSWVKHKEVNPSAIEIWETAKADGKVKDGVRIA